MNDVAKILLTGAIGFIGGILTRWPLEKFAERRAFVRSISDRYIELAQKPDDEPFMKSWNTKDEFWRNREAA
jgi:nucleoside-diphosphate-sugar epimerase